MDTFREIKPISNWNFVYVAKTDIKYRWSLTYDPNSAQNLCGQVEHLNEFYILQPFLRQWLSESLQVQY